MSHLNQYTIKNSIDRSTDGDQIDWVRLKYTIKENVLWFLLIFTLSFSGAVFYLRYTKPVFQSDSEIKLNKEDKVNIIGIRKNESTIGLISGEVELLQSRLFFNKIIESINLNPQYYTKGKILADEKFLTPPFKVEYKVKSINMYNLPITVIFLDSESFKLEYYVENKNYTYFGKFGDKLTTLFIDCVVVLNSPFNKEDDTNFYFVIKSKESLMNYIEKNLTVEPINLEANILRVSFKDYNSNKAYYLLNAIDSIYYNYSLHEKIKNEKNKIEYLDQQLLETEKKLDNFEKYFENFTIKNQTISLDNDIKQTLDSMQSINFQRAVLANNIAELTLFRKTLLNHPYKKIITSSAIYPQYLIKDFEEFNLLNSAFKKLSYKKNTYTFKSRQKEIELMRRDILLGIVDLKDKLEEQLKKINLEEQYLKNRLSYLPSKGTAFSKSKRFYTLYEKMYLLLMQSKNEFEIEVAGSGTKIKILSPASISNTPIYPIPIYSYGLAAVIAIIFCFFFIGIKYLIHNTIQGVHEIESLTQATVLGEVPKHKLKTDFAQIIVDKQPKSAISESLRSIRTNIEFIVPNKKSKVISVTSTVGSEGKTFISTNLGALFAMAGKKVIIVDLDLRKPKVHLAFGENENSTGVSSILIGKNTITESIQTSAINGLDFISTGAIPPNPSELILRKEFEELIDELKSNYDIVVLDTPPIGLVTDGLLAMQKADLPIYVMKANFSKRLFTKNINKVLATGKFNNLSIILNATVEKGGYGYGYGYGYGRKNSYYE